MKVKNLTDTVITISAKGGRSDQVFIAQPKKEIDVPDSVADDLEADNRVRDSRGLAPLWKIARPAKPRKPATVKEIT